MAQSRRKMLERTEWMESPDDDEKSASFGFTIERQSGNDVLSIDDLAIGYHDKKISSGITLRTFREDRIALVGPNGVGKSTLLKPSSKIYYHFLERFAMAQMFKLVIMIKNRPSYRAIKVC